MNTYDLVKTKEGLCRLNEHIKLIDSSPAFRSYIENSIVCNLSLDELDVLAIRVIQACEKHVEYNRLLSAKM